MDAGNGFPGECCSSSAVFPPKPTMVRTSHHCAGGTQERCGLVISVVSTAQALGLARGCLCC